MALQTGGGEERERAGTNNIFLLNLPVHSLIVLITCLLSVVTMKCLSSVSVKSYEKKLIIIIKEFIAIINCRLRKNGSNLLYLLADDERVVFPDLLCT